MKISNTLKTIEKKYAWSFLGFVLAIIFGGLAVYSEFIKDTRPIIKFEILSNTKILDVKENINGLGIYYNNEDIRNARKTLSVIVVKVFNDSKYSVLKQYYDINSPFGLQISAGEIIKTEVLEISNSYLNTTLKIKEAKDRVLFSDVIIEPNDYIILKLLVINPENTNISAAYIGKIANTRILLYDNMQSKKTGFISSVVTGSPWVQIVRMPVYTISFFLFTILIIAPIVGFFSLLSTYKRKKIVKQFKNHNKLCNIEAYESIFNYYIENGLYNIKKVAENIRSESNFNKLLEKYNNYPDKNKVIDEKLLLSFGFGSNKSSPFLSIKYLQHLHLIAGR